MINEGNNISLQIGVVVATWPFYCVCECRKFIIIDGWEFVNCGQELQYKNCVDLVLSPHNLPTALSPARTLASVSAVALVRGKRRLAGQIPSSSMPILTGTGLTSATID